MEQSVYTYTMEERKDIFEYVNNLHLHLRGEEKKRLKRAMVHSWKRNKSVGCLELFYKLYESYDTFDKSNDWFKEFCGEMEETPSDYQRRKIPLAKHRRIVGYREQENQELEERLENLMEEKGLMTVEESNEELRKMKSDMKRELDEKKAVYEKQYNEQVLQRDKTIAEIKRQEEKLKYYQELVKQLQTKD